jgi:hypothetical protein
VSWGWLLDKAATPAGVVVGTLLGWSKTVPGIGGAGALTFGVAVAAHSAWHWLPAYAVAAVVGGAFGLVWDRQI